MAAANVDNVVKQPSIRHVVLFKHGVGYFGFEATVQGPARLRLQMKGKEMDDILKSLFAADTSLKGFISTIGYDAAQDIDKVLENVSVRIPESKQLLVEFLADLKGASVDVKIAGDQVTGTIIGIDSKDEIAKDCIDHVPQLVLLERSTTRILRFDIPEIQSISLSGDIRKDLQFYLDTILSRKQKDAKNIVIHCEPSSQEHAGFPRQIYFSYIQEIPIWKTAYRLLLSPDDAASPEIPHGKGVLCGFGLVENQTPNEWNDVDLTLVAGAPVTFRYPLFEAQYIQRKHVPLPTKTAVRPVNVEDTILEGLSDMEDAAGAPLPGGGKGGFRASEPSAGESGLLMEKLKDAMKKSVIASTKDAGELFEYRINRPVSIARNQSALVPIVYEEIEAKKVLLFDRVNHPTNPFACVETKNTTALTFETGPLTIMIGDTLAGEAMLPFLIKDDVRLLNYALEQAVVIHEESKVETRSIHKISFQTTYLYEYKYEITRTSYKINNKASTKKVLYIDHPKSPGHSVIESPVPPKETSTRWRFSIDLEPKKATKVDIATRREISQAFYISDITRGFLEEHVGIYSRDKLIDSAKKELLDQVLALNEERARLNENVKELEAELARLNQEQGRLRETLKVLGGAASEVKLKERIIKKFQGQETRFGQIKEDLERLKKDIEKIEAKTKKVFSNL